MLFDDVERHELAPARYSDSEYGYLNFSARPEAERVRSVMEQWFSRYPSAASAELKGRMVSDINSPFFELMMHELLSRLGAEPDLHPPVPNSQSHPDFLFSTSEETTYVEAVVVDGMPVPERSARVRYERFLDAVNALETPDYFISADVRQVSCSPPNGRHIRHFLRQYLEALRNGRVQILAGEEEEQEVSLPWCRYRHEGWDVSFTAFRKSPKAIDKQGVRPLAIVSKRLQWVDSESLRECLREKARKYKSLPHPYIIALNVVSDVFDEADLMDCLFGKAIPVRSTEDTGARWRWVRRADGLWRSESGPRYTRVSGVLVCRVRSPWNMASAAATLYLNPWAQKPYQGVLCRLPSRVIEDGRLVEKEGVALADVFDIPKGWPEE